jgi:1-acyl-sn-glycerol-3-phosphate acyltransferase
MSAAGVLRRVVVVPAVLCLQATLILLSPALFLIAALMCAVQRSTRPWRSVGLVVAFASIELRAVAQLLRGVDDLDGFVRQILAQAYQAMNRVLAVPMVIEEGSPTPAEVQRSDGLIVLARHCGPGDSLYIAWLLAVHYGLSLRIVLKGALRLEPAIGLAAKDLPFCFVGHNKDSAIKGITALAATLGEGEALLLFPEGGNFNWARWRAGIRYLMEHGDYAGSLRARRRTHTLPPRPGGTLAALAAAPQADVLLIVHSGFSDDGRHRQWWRVPIRRDFLVRAMLFPAADVPREETAGMEFLERAWTQVDTWVEAFHDLNSPTEEPDEAATAP